MPYSFEQNCLKRFTWWVFIVTTVKLKKQAPGLIFSKALFEGIIFGGAYLWREICVSKLIGLALQFEGNFYRFCFVLLCIWGQFSKYKPPGGLYLKGQFNGGFFSLRVWGAYIWRGVYMKGLIFGILPYSDLIHPHTQDIQYSRRIQDFILILNHKACFPFLYKVTPGVSGYIPIKFPRGKPKFTQLCVYFIHRAPTKSVWRILRSLFTVTPSNYSNSKSSKIAPKGVDNLWSLKGKDSQLPLKGGHFLRTDTQCWSLSFFSHLTETILSIRRTPLRRTMDTFETFNGHALTEM